jgi:hypothetical protein
MATLRDGKGHVYANVSNIRVTYIPAADRDPDKDWADSDVLRVQSYRDGTSGALHQGAEIPIASPEIFGHFVAAICEAYADGRDHA